MSKQNRRQFLGRSLAAAGFGAGFAIAGTKSSGRILGANDTIRLGVAGLNSFTATYRLKRRSTSEYTAAPLPRPSRAPRR